MPGLLRPDACCPICGNALAVLIDESNRVQTKRTYYHDKVGKERRHYPCCKTFVDIEAAKIERTMLEVARLDGVTQ